jgi:hypothetical protein
VHGREIGLEVYLWLYVERCKDSKAIVPPRQLMPYSLTKEIDLEVNLWLYVERCKDSKKIPKPTPQTIDAL